MIYFVFFEILDNFIIQYYFMKTISNIIYFNFLVNLTTPSEAIVGKIKVKGIFCI